MRSPPAKGADTVRLQKAREETETRRISPAKESAETQKARRGPDTQPAQPEEVLFSDQAAAPPPVRQPKTESAGEALPSDQPSEAEEILSRKRAERRRRRTRVLIIGLTVLVGGFLGLAVFLVSRTAGQTEEDEYAKGMEAYKGKNFTEARKVFRSLETDFPRSDNLAAYRFYADMSEAREPAYSRPDDWEKTKARYESFLRFVRDRAGDKLMVDSRAEIGDTLYKFVDQLAGFAESDLSPEHLAMVRAAHVEAQKFRPEPPDDRDDKLERRFAEVVTRIRTVGNKKRMLAELERMSRNPTGDTVKHAREMARQLALVQPDARDDAQLTALLDKIVVAHRARVTYTRAADPTPSKSPAEDTEPSMLVAPVTAGKLTTPQTSPVLALARGVLYALRPVSGKVRWAARVGIDSTVLPVRLPAQSTTPETVLVVSADTQTVSALNVTDGKALWHHRLSALSLARPVVVEGRIFVACYTNGRVEEINASNGLLVGYYDLGQRLSLGGVYDEDTGFLYVPADSYCVYVLDVKQQRCAGILYTEHPTGAMRSEPIIVRWSDVPADTPRNPESPRSCLVLSQSVGLESTELRVYPLPIDSPKTQPLKLDLRVRGWAWFPPLEDGEKMAVATDAGVLGVFGIKQKNNRDKLFFPIFDKEIRLSHTQGLGQPGRASPAQLVHFDESSFWVLVDGELHRLQMTFGSAGWKMRELWDPPLALGSPLHASQVDRAGQNLFLVTRSKMGQACLASAVKTEGEGGGKDMLQWQTQLGLMCQGSPVLLDGTVLALDQHGGLFRIDPAKHQNDPRAAWHIQQDRAADPLTGERSRSLELLAIPGGAFALYSTGPEPQTRLVIRQFNAAAGNTIDHVCQLTASLAGTPGAWPDHLVFPMSNGALMRKQVPGGAPVPGPNWRSPQADEGAPGHVVPLNAEEFLVTDGSRGLIRLSWPQDNGNFQDKAQGKVAARIVSAPVVLPAPGGNNDFRVFVADADNFITLLHVDLKSDRFDEVRRVPLPGKITAGPWLVGRDVACLVDYRTLVLLDAEKNQQLWKYEAGAALVGRPALVGDQLVLADLDGRFVALDLAKGSPRGEGYKLVANVAPAASPVPFGPNRLFAPLTDGTVLLLSLERLQGSAKMK
jgi:outer membrane protein assembly factor BamB